MQNVAVTAPFTAETKARIQQELSYTKAYHFHFPETEEEENQVFETADIVIGNPPISQLKAHPHIHWVQMTWAGTDIYFSGEAFPENVLLTNATGAFGDIIAEYMCAVILQKYKCLGAYAKQQKAHKWQPLSGERTIQGQRVLILGAGDIGTSFARKMKVFGAKVIGIRRVQRACPQEFDEMTTMEHLEEELAKADVVACSLPNTEETKGLLNKDRLRLMKQDATLLNVGRGALIPLQDLEEVLKEDWFSDVLLDVTEVEPLPEDSYLWECPRVTITPHISGASFGDVLATQEKIADICIENLKRYYEGKSLKNHINQRTGYRELL